MGTIIIWLKRIIQIGILEFLSKLGWKVWAGALLAIVALVGVVIVLTLILVALIF